MSSLSWVRVSNATQDPHSRLSVAQDQIVRILGEDGDWYQTETIDGASGRVPKVLTLPIVDPNRLPGQFLYCSTDAYTSIRSDDLSFAPYSLFVASPSKTHEGYLEGYMVTDNGSQLGSSGLLPEGYLSRLESPTDQNSVLSQPMSSGIPPSFTTNFAEDVKFRAQNPATTSQYNVQPYARAIYDFHGEYENELSFTADEIINLKRRIDADWLEGSIGGSSRIGIFPASFVQIIVNLPEDDDDATSSSSAKRRSTTNENEGIGFAIVKHAFDGRQADELSVKAGDTVRVLRMVNDEWVMCKDPDTERNGIVPVGFLEVYLDDEDEDNTTKKQSITDASFTTLNRNSFAAPSNIADWRTSTRIESQPWSGVDLGAPPKPTTQWATFGEDWIAAEQPKSSAPARPPPPKQVSIQSPNEIVSVTEMFGMAERQAPPRPVAPSSMFQSASDFEIGLETATAGANTNEEKRAKILEELISSELQFVVDINAYTEAVDSSTLLSNKQKIIMKNGCAQIVQLSGNLVQLLTGEQVKPIDAQQIGGCFLHLRKQFAQTYGYYFRNIEHINQLLTSAKTEKSMEEALSDLVQRMKVAGAVVIDGSTAVGRPVQRCLKYPLFLNEIVKLTPINHNDHPKLNEAIKTMSNLGQKMNESKRRKELARKYMQEDRQTFGEMLSKMTFHSLKKKSNRFTYRMGSSLGVVKLLKDVEFDNLVCELDSSERRLVRFNYMLVIYRKKIFHETRVLIHKKLIEPRKKAISNSDAEHQTFVFHEAVRDYSLVVNVKIRDEIVKTLRSIPKRLIKKRNDKLMDYEAAKSKGNSKRDFTEIQKDYEALNAQVKSEIPKCIETLNRVLCDAMKALTKEDMGLMERLRKLFREAQEVAEKDPSMAQSRRLILANSTNFVAYYDPDRLKPLQKIANKANIRARTQRDRARSASPAQRNGSTSGSTKTKKTSLMDKNSEWNAATPTIVESFQGPHSSQEVGKQTFRPQSAEERKTILEKATSKGRLDDMFVATSHYPTDPGMLKLAIGEGKLLIVRQNDLVLAVNREVPSMWLCYNGYYNAMLPSSILKPIGKSVEIGIDVVNRPQSTPVKSQNLMDLEDIFGENRGAQVLNPSPVVGLSPVPLVPVSLTPTNSQIDWPAAAKTLPIAPAPPQNLVAIDAATPAAQIQPPPGGVNYNLDDEHLFDGLASIDWGASSSDARTRDTPADPFQPGIFNPNSLPDTAPPPLPVILNPALEASTFFSENCSAKFAVSFNEPTNAQLPPSGMAQRSASAAAKPLSNFTSTSPWPGACTSSTTTRSDSPQPLIPSRPAPTVRENNLYPNLTPSYDTPPLQPTPANIPPIYSVVPNEMVAAPMYDVTPTAASVYDAPPQQYDQPPVETPQKCDVRPVLCQVRADYEFVPQGSNQVAVKEGENVSVLQRTDDDGNPEWLLVKRSNGQVGYVPAAYCRPV